MKNPEVTVVIPTHNRPHFLERSVDWFRQLGLTFLVADSSQKKWKAARLQKIPGYYWFPGGFEIYVRKIRRILSKVKTPFVALCGDDDYLLPSGLESACRFLALHPEYVGIQGGVSFFQVLQGKVHLWPFLFEADLNQRDWLDRLGQKRFTLFYGVVRTKALQRVFAFLERQKVFNQSSSAGVLDYALNVLLLREGRVRYANFPFSLRQYSRQVICVGSRHELFHDENLAQFYRALIRRLGLCKGSTRASMIQKQNARDWACQIAYDASNPDDVGVSTGTRRMLTPAWLQGLHRKVLLWRQLSRKAGWQAWRSYWTPEIKRVCCHMLAWEKPV